MTVVVRATVEKHYDFPDKDDIQEALRAAKSDFTVPDGAVLVDADWFVDESWVCS